MYRYFVIYLLMLVSCSSKLDMNFPEFNDNKINLSYIQSIKEEGFNFNRQDFNGHYPLQFIFKNYHQDSYQILKYLDKEGVDILQVLEERKTILNEIVQYPYDKAYPLLEYIFKNHYNRKKFSMISNPLVEASGNKHANAIKLVQYLISYFSVNASSQIALQTPLMISILNNGEDGYKIFQFLLKHNTNVKLKDRDKLNIFHYLAMSCSSHILDMMNDLKKYWHLLNQVNSFNKLPIERLLSEGNNKKIMLLFNKFLKNESKKVYFSSNHINKLLIAASKNQSIYMKKLVSMVLKIGAFVNYQDDLGNTALFYVAENSNFNNLRVISSLVQGGASIYIKNKLGNNVLVYSTLNTSYNALMIIKYFLRNGLSFYTLFENKNNLLHYAAQNKGKYANQIMEYLLLNTHLSVKKSNQLGYTPLMYATLNTGDAANHLIRTIIIYGYQGEPAIDTYNSPVLSAVTNPSKNAYSILTNLIKTGFQINGENQDGQNILILAVQNEGLSTLKILKYLFLKSVYLNHQDKYGNTALMYAFYNTKYRFPIIQFLLKKGANPYIKNSVQDNFISLVKQSPTNERKIFEKLLMKYSKPVGSYQMLNL